MHLRTLRRRSFGLGRGTAAMAPEQERMTIGANLNRCLATVGESAPILREHVRPPPVRGCAESNKAGAGPTGASDQDPSTETSPGGWTASVGPSTTNLVLAQSTRGPGHWRSCVARGHDDVISARVAVVRRQRPVPR